MIEKLLPYSHQIKWVKLTALKTVWQQFRAQGQLLVNQLTGLNDEQLGNTALHPRLKTPMRIIDLAYFVAEHVDYHLACIREMLR